MLLATILWCLVCSVTLQQYGNCASISETCNEPKDLQKRFSQINNGLDMRQLLIPHEWSDLDIEFEHLYTFTNSHEISRNCPETTIRGVYPLMFRASCPWFLATDWSDDRYPKSIVFAKTQCVNGCVGSREQRCERIHHQIKILKKTGCIDGIYQYKEHNFLLPIGYTCAQGREFEKSVAVSPPQFPEPM